jgi:hypothetical protein
MLLARVIEHQQEFEAGANAHLSPYSAALADLEAQPRPIDHETPQSALDASRRDWEALQGNGEAFDTAIAARDAATQLREARVRISGVLDSLRQKLAWDAMVTRADLVAVADQLSSLSDTIGHECQALYDAASGSGAAA